jgi:pimeloyl-ACP methyl ester carboxylesterase
MSARATASYITETGVGERERLLRQGLTDSAIAARQARRLANSTAEALVAMTRAMGNLMIAPERRLAVRVPALVAVGTADNLLDNSRKLASWWSGARFVEVQGATHGELVRRPEVLLAIRDLLRTVSPGPIK